MLVQFPCCFCFPILGKRPKRDTNNLRLISDARPPDATPDELMTICRIQKKSDPTMALFSIYMRRLANYGRACRPGSTRHSRRRHRFVILSRLPASTRTSPIGTPGLSFEIPSLSFTSLSTPSDLLFFHFSERTLLHSPPTYDRLCFEMSGFSFE